ncbi:MAG: hypothetical protein ACKO96_40560, partial [Flammeovirgaceae bacterium]
FILRCKLVSVFIGLFPREHSYSYNPFFIANGDYGIEILEGESREVIVFLRLYLLALTLSNNLHMI